MPTALEKLEKLRLLREAAPGRGVIPTVMPTVMPTDASPPLLARNPPTNPTEAARPVMQAADFSPAASAVLAVLAEADRPVPHPGIVKALAGRGHGKAAACEAIALCQRRGWIGHDLTGGYVLGDGGLAE